jgi:hypothetical protein
MSNEITFIIPNSSNSSNSSSQSENAGGTVGNSASDSVAEDLYKVKISHQNVPNDIRVLIVWLEQFQDADNIPIGN